MSSKTKGDNHVMKVASFNANSIRARLPIITDWLMAERPDILCVQETKVQDKDFPAQAFEGLGYHCAFFGQKSYNGVAILSRQSPNAVVAGFEDEVPDEQARLLKIELDSLTVVNTYIPQGQDPQSEKFQYKLAWFERLKAYFTKHCDPEGQVLWVGDFNVAPQPVDVYDPDRLAGHVGYHPDEHAALQAVMDWGFVDVFRRHNPHEQAFTFWDYRIPNAVKRGLGWRIDLICATRPLAARSTRAWVDVAPRLKPRPSDHTFIVAEFQIKL
jgi:exodeoxyribonuclease-3